MILFCPMLKHLNLSAKRTRGRPPGNINFYRLVAIIASQISFTSKLSDRELEVFFNMGDIKDGHKGRAWRRYRDGGHGMSRGKLNKVIRTSAGRKWLGEEWHSLFCPDYFAPELQDWELQLAEDQGQPLQGVIQTCDHKSTTNLPMALGDAIWSNLRKYLVEGGDKFKWKIDIDHLACVE